VVSSNQLDSNDMVIDFKALKLTVMSYIDRFDHTMAVNSNDPLLESIRALHPEGVVIFEDQDPTTEAIAKDLFDYVESRLRQGCSFKADSGQTYVVSPGSVELERVRVWETPSSWAEYGV
jgi:6-pyruvoyltetrahydropterin/6-carboxytetrahydropterin synthase